MSILQAQKRETDLEGLQAVLVDDTLRTVTDQFASDEQRTREVFQINLVVIHFLWSSTACKLK